MGMGGAVQVSSRVVVMLSVRVLSELQAICHCSFVRWLCSNSMMSLSMWFELLSKNLMWKFSILSFGMELSSLGCGSGVMGGGLVMSVFGGIFSCMGK